MAKCNKCFQDRILNKRTCSLCISKWKENRLKLFNQLSVEMGGLNASNQLEFNKRLKKLERENPPNY